MHARFVRCVWVAIVAACGGPTRGDSLQNQAGKAAAPPAIVKSRSPDDWLSARPVQLDLSGIEPNLDEELRWPLAPSSHPVLEPRYPIAQALAEPGIEYGELCRRGIQARHAPTAAGQEQIDYLRAWCAVGNHDVEAAVARLAPLVHPIVTGLGAAVTLDLANILTDGCTADTAVRLIAKHTIVDPAVLDTLAATYLEVERPDDARDVNTTVMLGDSQPGAATCHRHVRDIALAPSYVRKDLAVAFAKLAPTMHDARCRELSNLASCWVSPLEWCDGYLADQQLDPKYQKLIEAYDGWPTEPTDYEGWISIATDGVMAAPLGGADRLAIVALEAALRTSHCKATRVLSIATQAELLAPQFTSTELSTRLATLRALDNTNCVDLATRSP